MSDFDYTSPGASFVTFVTAGRQVTLGEVVDDGVRVSPPGLALHRQVEMLSEQYPSVRVESFVIMPDHVHLLLWLEPTSSHSAPSLSDVIRWLKSASSRAMLVAAKASRERLGSVWRKGFHDRVVRDENELARIRDSIVANPANWALDQQNPGRPRDTQLPSWELPGHGADGGKPHPCAGARTTVPRQ